jgi:hypothetical protein
MLPVIEKFMATNRLAPVADPDMIAEANRKAIEGYRTVIRPWNEGPRCP